MKKLLIFASISAALLAVGCSMKYFEAQVKAEEVKTIGVERSAANSSATAVANENAAHVNAAPKTTDESDCADGECSY